MQQLLWKLAAEYREFQRGVLDSLRRTIESGETVVARANAHVCYPARFSAGGGDEPCRYG